MIPPEPGTYVLFLNLVKARAIRVGGRGEPIFPAGIYAYYGSALGPGGLQARIGRHIREIKRPHWHIDALRAAAAPLGVGWRIRSERLECAWAQVLAALPGSRQPVPGFGSSDCRSRCGSHLVWLGEAAGLDHLRIWQASIEADWAGAGEFSDLSSGKMRAL